MKGLITSQHGKSGFLTEFNKINVLSNKGFPRIWCNAITSQNGNCQYTGSYLESFVFPSKSNFGLTVKNKGLLGCGDFPHTYTFDNTGKRKSAFTAYLSHQLTGKVIVKNDVKVQPPTADMLQPPTADEQHVNNVNICRQPHSVVMQFTPVTDIRIRRKGLSTFQHSPMTKVKYLQTFPQIEEVPKTDQTLAFLSNLLRNFRNASRARTGRETHLKDKKVIAKEGLNNYPSFALSKISRLALVGYDKSAHIVRLGLFLCVISLCVRIIMAKLEGEAFALASYLIYWSTNPFQLCHPYLVVNGRASVIKSGVHTHA